MMRKRVLQPEIRTILMIDTVNSTAEMKLHGREVIAPKIKALREVVEFCFVYKLKSIVIGELGDGFLLLCPPEAHQVLAEAFTAMQFVRAYNLGVPSVKALQVRMAIHYGLVAPPDGGNYLDSNLHFAARLEGATPANTVCVSAVVHDIVATTLRQYAFTPLDADFKGLGQTQFYAVQRASDAVVAALDEEPQRSF